jgi:hypothetical protein
MDCIAALVGIERVHVRQHRDERFPAFLADQLLRVLDLIVAFEFGDGELVLIYLDGLCDV